MNNFDLIIKNGNVVSREGVLNSDIGILDGKIVCIDKIDTKNGGKIFDAKGLHILPGLIDTQVHFREPGMVDAEDIESGTRGAVLGGITGVFEMPNTTPPTDSYESLKNKLNIASNKAWCNYAFYIGGTHKNFSEIGELERLHGCCGIKVFMGASTGNLLIPDDETLSNILSNGFRRVAVHCEDNERINARKNLRGNDVKNHPLWRDELTAIKATKRLLNLARKNNRRVHVLHITTQEEIDYLTLHKDIATIEVTPQHLTLYSPDCYERLGTLAQMNPPIRGIEHQNYLWKSLNNGVIDIIGSDHAPHTVIAKSKEYPNSPSGITGVQTTVPLMLDHVSKGRLSIQSLVDLLSYSPARIFGLINKGKIAVGYDADLTIVDLKAKNKIFNSLIASKSSWTAYDGMEVNGWPIGTIINGSIVMKEGSLITGPSGQPYKFYETEYN
ncbi:dihydroorotase [Alphaproteobacteria bacterium]|nr:dihydroorotase [Alphaproteobacteria bacterium]